MHARKYFVVVLLTTAVSDVRALESRFVFEAAEALPEVMIGGKAAKIHTQGLMVTDEAYLVTGRLETTPKRALLLRFSRQQRGKYEWVDITPASDVLSSERRTATLDHPGGFDVDSKGQLCVPISTSDRRGPSLLYRFRIDPQKSLDKLHIELVCEVDDHIGAICCSRVDDTLIGANWDTVQVYRWSREGKLIAKRVRSELFLERPEWQLAVQDWKAMPMSGDLIIAGGIDKAETRPTNSSRAVVQFLDLQRRQVVSSHRLPELDSVSRPVTNEGLCWFQEKLYLLPEDIGRGAKVLRYRLDE